MNISRGGYDRMFAFPQDVRRAAEYALKQGNDIAFIRAKPGEVMGSLAHAHPFLDGNGRTIMTVHTVLAARAGISVAWEKTDKEAYLTALTKEVHLPGDGHLDAYLKPFVRGALAQKDQVASLAGLRGLGPAPAAAGEAATPTSVEHQGLGSLGEGIDVAAAHLDGTAKAEFLTRAAAAKSLLRARAVLQTRQDGGTADISFEEAQAILGSQAAEVIARARGIGAQTAAVDSDDAQAIKTSNNADDDVHSGKPARHRPLDQ